MQGRADPVLGYIAYLSSRQSAAPRDLKKNNRINEEIFSGKALNNTSHIRSK